jgi:hypothetical protein
LTFGEFAEWSSLLLNPQASSDALDTHVFRFSRPKRGVFPSVASCALRAEKISDEALVWQAFDEHPSMVLRRSDIVASGHQLER